MSDNKKRWIKRIIILALATAITLWVTISRYQERLASDPINVFHAVSDGLFVSGFLNLGFGILIWVSSTGFFDIFGYSLKSFFNFFLPRSWSQDKGTYYEYKVKKQERRKDPLLPMETLYMGIGFLVVSFVLTFFA